MDFLDRADGALLDDADGLLVNAGGMDLDAHLRDHFAGTRELGQPARLVDVVGEGLLAIDMFAQLQGGHGDGGVHVIGHGDVDGLNGLFLVKQLAPVLINLHVREFLFDRFGAAEVNVGDGDQPEGGMGGEALDVGGGHARRAEAGVQQCFAGRGGADAAGQGGRDGDAGGGQGGAAEELAAGEGGWHGAAGN